jgi:hypothetical protein
MPRLFIGNFGCEYDWRESAASRLARSSDAARRMPIGPAFFPPKSSGRPSVVEQLAAELATNWLLAADDGDLVWTPSPIDVAFWDHAAREGLPRLRPVTDLAVAAAIATHIEPWGWTERLANWVRTVHPHAAVPDVAAVAQINSRRWSVEQELTARCGPPGLALCTSVDAVADAVQSLCNGRATLPNQPNEQNNTVTSHNSWLLKSNWGVSGREQRRGRGALTKEDVRWIERQLVATGAVVVEPWLTAVAEAGLQWTIPRNGRPQFEAAVPMLPMRRGQYAGSWVRQPGGVDGPSTVDDRFSALAQPDWWTAAWPMVESAVLAAQQAGYCGPLGIDVMWVRHPDGSHSVRALQDINARWTMGRLAWLAQRFVPEDRIGYWWHGAASASETDATAIAKAAVGPGTRQDLASPTEPPVTPSLLDARGDIASHPGDSAESGDSDGHRRGDQRPWSVVGTSPIRVGATPARHVSRLVHWPRAWTAAFAACQSDG